MDAIQVAKVTSSNYSFGQPAYNIIKHFQSHQEKVVDDVRNNKNVERLVVGIYADLSINDDPGKFMPAGSRYNKSVCNRLQDLPRIF